MMLETTIHRCRTALVALMLGAASLSTGCALSIDDPAEVDAQEQAATELADEAPEGADGTVVTEDLRDATAQDELGPADPELAHVVQGRAGDETDSPFDQQLVAAPRSLHDFGADEREGADIELPGPPSVH